MKSLVGILKNAIIRQEKKQKNIAKNVFVSECHLCRILNGRAPLQPEVVAGLLKELHLEDLANFYCAGCPVNELKDRRQSALPAA